MLEKVQHRFTRMFTHLKKLSYEVRLEELGLWSFEERRNRADIEVFKMVKQMSSVPWNRFFKRAEDSVTRGHSWKLVKDCCRRDCRLHFFSQRVINRWNSLSQDDIDAASLLLTALKNRLEIRRKRQMDFFKDWMSTTTSPFGCTTLLDLWRICLMIWMMVPGAAEPGE